jgi:hypothetical protein
MCLEGDDGQQLIDEVNELGRQKEEQKRRSAAAAGEAYRRLAAVVQSLRESREQRGLVVDGVVRQV